MKSLCCLAALAFATSVLAQKKEEDVTEPQIEEKGDKMKKTEATDTDETVPEVLEKEPSKDSEKDKEAPKESTEAEPEEAPKKPEPEKVTLHYIVPGGSLTAVSEEAYGRTRYWRILKLYNEVDPSKLQVGQEIKAPDIAWLIEKSGLQEKFPEAVANMLSAKDTLTEIEDKSSTPTDDDLAEIKKAASLIGKAQALLIKDTPGVTGKPNATVQQLQTVRNNLIHVANKTKQGRTDPNSLAHEHMSNAIVYGILWARGDFK